MALCRWCGSNICPGAGDHDTPCTAGNDPGNPNPVVNRPPLDWQGGGMKPDRDKFYFWREKPVGTPVEVSPWPDGPWMKARLIRVELRDDVMVFWAANEEMTQNSIDTWAQCRLRETADADKPPLRSDWPTTVDGR
jgi:hypothetical protein